MKMTCLGIIIVLFASFYGCKEGQRPADELLLAAPHDEQLKANFEKFIEYAWNNANTDSLKTLLVENYVKHLNGIQIVENTSEMAANMNIYFKGFPDGMMKLVNVQVKENNLFSQWIYTGTNTGIFGEYPPTGKKVAVHGYSNVQFNTAGKMVKEDVYYNELELLQQLGYTLHPPVLE